MRRLRYNAAVTLDGFIASPDGSTDWIVHDTSIDFDALYAEFDTFIMGRKTYEVMVSLGEQNPLFKQPREAVIVVSQQMDPQRHPNITILSDNIFEAIRELKGRQGRDIWLMGGGQLARLCLDSGLVDSVEAAIMPVVIGQGIKMIGESIDGSWKPNRLQVEQVKHLEGSGILMTTYRVLTAAD